MKKYFSKDLIMLGINAESYHDVIYALSNLLYENGYVKLSFASAVIEREEKFATGLPCEVCGIAIPHTDPIHVKKMAIAIGVLDKPIQFGMMGGQERIDVDLVFLLALKDCQSQILMLQKFAEFFQYEKEIQNIREATTRETVLEIMKKNFYQNPKDWKTE